MATRYFRWIVFSLVLLAGSLTFSGSVFAQQAERDCKVRKEPSGLIRGDRVPSGCVLETEPMPRPKITPTPYISCDPRKFYTPNPKTSVLANCARLSRGRMIIPTVPVVPPPKGGLSFSRGFGSLEGSFGRTQRNFGPIQRNFGSRPAVRPAPLNKH